MLRHAALAGVAAALAGCAGFASRIAVTPAESGVVLAPRPADCKVEFYRTKSPERAYDEVATLHFTGTNLASAAGAQEMMRERACEVGADAVIVTRDFIHGTQYTPGAMTGTAVSYRDLRQQHRLDAALRRAEEDKAAAAAREAAARETAAKAGPTAGAVAGPPAGYVPARVTRAATAHEIADRRGKEVGDVAAGAEVWAAPKASSGWRRIWRPGEQAAWIEDDTLELRSAARAPAPSTDPATKAGTLRTDI